MTSTPVASLSSARQVRPLISRPEWAWAALIGGFFVWFHLNFIWRMVLIATDASSLPVAFRHLFSGALNPDWSHALVIPFISLYYLRRHRDALRNTPRRISWPGLAILFGGLLSYAWWIAPGRNDMLQGYSMILALFGLVLFILGPAAMRIAWFPILFLIFSVKVSDRLWDDVAFRLQILAAHAATFCLTCLSIDATVDGSTIKLYRGLTSLGQLNVAEACAGLRMLMAFMALGVAVAFLSVRPAWQRVVMVLMTVPIAVAVNIARVTVLGLLFLVNPSLATGEFHKFIGMLMLIPALLLYLLLGWVLERIIVPVEGEQKTVEKRFGIWDLGFGIWKKQSSNPLSPEPHMPSATTGDAQTPRSSADADKSQIPNPKSQILPSPPPSTLAGAVTFGALLSLLVGAVYALLFATVRPDLLGDHLSRGVAGALAALAAGALAAAVAGTRRLARRSGPAGNGPIFGSAVGAGVLIAAVLGLNGVLWANSVVLHKDPVDIRRPLVDIPTRLGTWEKVGEDRKLPDDEEEALGTRQYLVRAYRDNLANEGLAPGTARSEGTGGTPAGPLVVLHVAYYTGTPDTVPHVPERCFVAGGLANLGVSRVSIALDPRVYRTVDGQPVAFSRLRSGDVRLPATSFDATRFTFGVDDGRQANVVYFFAANGRFLPTPDLVRLGGFDPRDRYSYYCKIEVGLMDTQDPALAVRRADAFLSAALPEIMACLPDWDDVTHGRWPQAQAQAPEAQPVRR